MDNNQKMDITTFSEYRNIHEQFTDDYIKTNRCVKYSDETDGIEILVSEKYVSNIKIIQSLYPNRNIDVVTVQDSDFVEFIGNYVEKTTEITDRKDNKDNTYNLENISSDAPVVNIINAICLAAIRNNASDIHIQGDKTNVKVRFRIDGVLQTVKTLPLEIFSGITNRIKVMSGLNVMENRLCQDGRMSVVTENNNIDFRVSIVPTTNGQSIVLRLFNTCRQSIPLEELGFSETSYSNLNMALSLPNGMILVTGPTGSGKTTTLHALISKMDKEHLKIVTIEDPVEKEIDGVDQVQVNDEIGLTFNAILRRVLRQDPDVIMVGEIRDEDTANLAVRAALTGHLILSTLHTNDSVSAITRLKNLGIEPYLISSVLKLSIAQRLIRKTCRNCNGTGCGECTYTGYKGRTAISESFFVDNELAKKIETGESEDSIRETLINKRFSVLKKDAKRKLEMGITTLDELKREGLT